MTSEAEQLKEELSYLSFNGSGRQLTTTNIKMTGGQLIQIDALVPFPEKNGEGEEVESTEEDAHQAKRKLYKEFFRNHLKTF